jgi:bacterioferritin-associated ferredoxin
MFHTLAMCHYPHPTNTTVQRILSRPEVNALLRVAAHFAGLRTEMAVSSECVHCLCLPIAVAARSRARTVFARSDTWIVGSNPT